MNYIVFDLEWNQCPIGKDGSNPALPFEIIEIGAVKLDSNFNKIDEFHRVVRPVVYKKLHFRVLEVVNIGVDELRNDGDSFSKVCNDFLDWCYEFDDNGVAQAKAIFCTWGDMDLTQLQKNMRYFNVPNPFPYPLLYYDVQKLYSLVYLGQKKTVEPLDQAVEEMGIEQSDDFHRALVDANYTALVMQKMDIENVREYMSLDYFRIPHTKEEEIYLIFPDYSKYVSRAYDTKEEAMNDKVVTDIVCYRCNRTLRKRVGWFSSNQKQYHCVGYCPEHGFVKGKIRAKHAPDGKVFIVKTIKQTTEEKAKLMAEKREEIAKAKAEKNRLKRKRKL